MPSRRMSIAAIACAFALPAVHSWAQGPAGLRVNVYLDDQRYKAEAKRLEDQFTNVIGYRQLPARDGKVQVVPANDDLMRLWKANGAITPASAGLFEGPEQFMPTWFVLEVTNEGTAAAEIVRAYLRVRQSLTDRQPLIRMEADEACSGWTSIVHFYNDGWRSAENAVLDFGFGPPGATTATFRANLGTLGNVAYDPVRVLTGLMPALPALRAKPPRCPAGGVPGCLARMAAAGQLGGLAGKVRIEGGEKDRDEWHKTVTVTVSGTLSYEWKHHPSNEVRSQRHPFSQEIMLFEFDTGQGPECGGGGPMELGYDAVTLQTDTAAYQVSLPYRGPVPPRGNRRLALPVKAERASSHEFEVVVETSDGRVAVSPPVSLLYFVPTRNRSPLRELH